MSDSSYAHVSQKTKIIDIIDQEWVEDSLSDDEITVPKEFELKKEFDEEDDVKINDDDTWSDLGLENFVEQMLHINPHPTAVTAQSQSSNLGPRTA